MKTYLSLIVPCYNEAEHLEKSFPRVIEVLQKLKKNFEVIIIDDRSRDNTVEIVRKLIKKNKGVSIKFIQHKKNVGRGGTVAEGIMAASGDIVGFIDIDLEVSPSYIPHFISLLKTNKADIVIGQRIYPIQFFDLQYFIRTFLSIGYSLLIKLIFNLPVRDTETGYKFFKREKIIPVLGRVRDKHWFWDTEIIIMGVLHGLRIREEPVRFSRSKEKTSTVELIPDITKYFKALLLFKMALLKEGTHFGKLYSFPFIYTFAMRILFGKNYDIRYLSIARLIEPKNTVVDVCCGDCILHRYLKGKNVRYLGLDISPAFVNRALKNGISARLFDLREDEVQAADYVILQGSLYQFKNPGMIVKKLYNASSKKLIISETIKTVSTHRLSKNPLIGAAVSLLVGTENKNALFRFEETSLKKLLAIYEPHYIEAGKDLIAVIEKK